MNDGPAFLAGLVFGLIAVVLLTCNLDVDVYPQTIEQANKICVNYGGVSSFSVDNGRELTVFCKDSKFTTMEKK